MTRNDPGAARGTSTYPPQRGACVTCSHSEYSHRFVATKVERAECSVTTHLGACSCTEYREASDA